MSPVHDESARTARRRTASGGMWPERASWRGEMLSLFFFMSIPAFILAAAVWFLFSGREFLETVSGTPPASAPGQIVNIAPVAPARVAVLESGAGDPRDASTSGPSLTGPGRDGATTALATGELSPLAPLPLESLFGSDGTGAADEETVAEMTGGTAGTTRDDDSTGGNAASGGTPAAPASGEGPGGNVAETVLAIGAINIGSVGRASGGDRSGDYTAEELAAILPAAGGTEATGEETASSGGNRPTAAEEKDPPPPDGGRTAATSRTGGTAAGTRAAGTRDAGTRDGESSLAMAGITGGAVSPLLPVDLDRIIGRAGDEDDARDDALDAPASGTGTGESARTGEWEISVSFPGSPLWTVQIGARRTRALAEGDLSRLRARAGDLIGEQPVAITEVDIPGKGTFYRIRVGRFPDATEAGNWCRELKERRLGDCYATRQ